MSSPRGRRSPLHRVSSKDKHLFHNGEESEGGEIPFFPPSKSFIFDERGHIALEVDINWHQKIFITLDHPTSSRFGKIIAYVMLFAIVLSSLVFVVASDPSIHITPDSCSDPVCDNNADLCPNQVICSPEPPVALFYIEAFCVIIFAIEYILRLATVWFMNPCLVGIVTDWSNKKESNYPPWKVFSLYVIKVMNIIDLVAILPFFLEFFGGSGSSLSIVRIMRLGRMLRLIKSSKYNNSMDIFLVTFKRSKASLKVLFVMNFMLAVIFAALVYTFEKGTYTINDDYPNGAYLRPNLLGNGEEESPFVSIWTALFWSIVTGSTVGYGELYPTTTAGRIIASLWIYSSIFVIALPISVLGGNFLHCLEEKATHKRTEKELRKSIVSLRRDSNDSNLEMIPVSARHVFNEEKCGDNSVVESPNDSSKRVNSVKFVFPSVDDEGDDENIVDKEQSPAVEEGNVIFHCHSSDTSSIRSVDDGDNNDESIISKRKSSIFNLFESMEEDIDEKVVDEEGDNNSTSTVDCGIQTDPVLPMLNTTGDQSAHTSYGTNSSPVTPTAPQPVSNDSILDELPQKLMSLYQKPKVEVDLNGNRTVSSDVTLDSDPVTVLNMKIDLLSTALETLLVDNQNIKALLLSQQEKSQPPKES